MWICFTAESGEMLTQADPMLPALAVSRFVNIWIFFILVELLVLNICKYLQNRAPCSHKRIQWCTIGWLKIWKYAKMSEYSYLKTSSKVLFCNGKYMFQVLVWNWIEDCQELRRSLFQVQRDNTNPIGLIKFFSLPDYFN